MSLAFVAAACDDGGETSSTTAVGTSTTGVSSSNDASTSIATTAESTDTDTMAESTSGASGLGSASSSDVGESTSDVGASTSGVGESTSGVGETTSGVGESTSGVGESTSGVGASNTDAGESSTGLLASSGGDPSTGSSSGDPLPITCDEVKIKIPGYFPEGISVDAVGRLYIGSIGTQRVVRRQACGTEPQALETFVHDDTLNNVIGVLVDEATQVLWLCNSNNVTFQDPSIRAYTLEEGNLVVEHPFGDVGEPGFCNDLTLDGDGNLYATDSGTGRVMRVAQADLLTPGSAVEWADDPAFDISGFFSINGITWDGASSLYTVKSEGGRLFRIDLAETDPAIVEIDLDRTLEGGDGLEWMGGNQLLVNENGADRVSVITLDGDSASVETLYDNLADQPTTSVRVDDVWFIVQSQLAAVGTGPGVTPFRVVTRSAL